jgi:4-amino-4-deoxy-L-arabinose transferase-like glycosyltransferase
MTIHVPDGGRLWMLLIGLAGGVLSLPLLSYHFAFDQGIYAAIGDSLLRGGVAYRDAWELRPPGVFYAYYLSFLLLGRAPWAVHALEVLALAFTCAGLYRVGAIHLRSRTAGVVAALALPLLYVPFGHWNSAQCESFQQPFLVWGLACWPDSEEPGRRERRCLLAGVLLGAAVMTKLPAIVFCLVFVLESLLTDVDASCWKDRLRPTLVTLAGMGLLPALVLLYYTLRGALPQLLDAWVTYPVEYARFSGGDSFEWHRRMLVNALSCFSLPVQLLLAVAVLRSLLGGGRPALRWLAVLLAGVGALAMQRKYYGYHHLVLLPFVSLGVGLATKPLQIPLSAFVSVPKKIVLGGAFLGIAALAGLGLVYLIRSNTPRWGELTALGNRVVRDDRECALGRFSYARDVSLAAAIRSMTRESDSVFLWTNEPLAYFLSDRRMGGPYSHPVLVVPPWAGDERLHYLVRRLQLEKPRLIVTGGDGALFRPESSEELLRVYPGLREFIEDNYVEAARRDEFRFWLRSK